MFHALLIGINEYKSEDISNLRGCLRDIEMMSEYLKKVLPNENQLNLIPPITNEKATKQNIVNAIQTKLGKAKSGDTILFYFSGHGCQEAFTHFGKEDKIEALVCHDSQDGATTLADKEVRYLFHQVAEKTQARIVLITDSCNSGGATRSALAVRRLGKFADNRNWEDFIFSNEIPRNTVNNMSELNDKLPQGKHIHMSACRSNQSAFETTKNGVFTTTLIEILNNTQGIISFNELHERVKFLVRRRQKQTPQLYAFDPESIWQREHPSDSILNTQFLPGKLSDSASLSNIYCEHDLWILGKGAIHGMPILEKAKELELNIINRNTGKIESTGIINKVGINDSFFTPNSPLDSTKVDQYQGQIKGLYLLPLNIYLEVETPKKWEEIKEQVETYDQANDNLISTYNLCFTKNRDQADYMVFVNQQGYKISRPELGRPAKEADPICEKIQHNTEALKKLLSYLSAIAHWEFVSEFHNPKPKKDLVSQLNVEVIYQKATGIIMGHEMGDVELIGTETTLPVELQKDENVYPIDIELPKPRKANHLPFIYFKIKISNKGRRSLNVFPLYMGQLFDISTGVVYDEGDLIRLGPETDTMDGTTIYAFGDEFSSEPMLLSDFITEFNWEEEVFSLKLLMSNTEFNAGKAFIQAPLPPPTVSFKEAGRGDDQPSRRLKKRPKDWAAIRLQINMKNPDYQNPNQNS